MATASRTRLILNGEKAMMRDLFRLGPEARDVGKDVLGAAVARIVPRVKPRTPVQADDGGQLRASVRKSVRVSKKTGRVTASVIAGGRPTEEAGKKNVYARVQEAGKMRRAGRTVTLTHSVGESPFMETEVFREAVRVPGRLRSALDKRIKP